MSDNENDVSVDLGGITLLAFIVSTGIWILFHEQDWSKLFLFYSVGYVIIKSIQWLFAYGSNS